MFYPFKNYRRIVPTVARTVSPVALYTPSNCIAIVFWEDKGSYFENDPGGNGSPDSSGIFLATTTPSALTTKQIIYAHPDIGATYGSTGTGYSTGGMGMSPVVKEGDTVYYHWTTGSSSYVDGVLHVFELPLNA